MKKIILTLILSIFFCNILQADKSEEGDSYDFIDNNHSCDYDEINLQLFGNLNIATKDNRKHIGLNYDKTPLRVGKNKVAVDFNSSTFYIEGKSKHSDPKIGISFKF